MIQVLILALMASFNLANARMIQSQSVDQPNSHANWEQVIDLITQKGNFEEVANGLETYLSLDDYSSQNPDQSYNRKMISLVGARNSNGTFFFSKIYAVDEDWSKDQFGNNVGYLYQFILNRDGTLAKVSLVKLVKESTGSELVIEHHGLDLTPAEGQSRWDANHKYWIKRAEQSY